MARSTGCLKGCALGCGGLFFLGLLLLGGALIVSHGLSSQAVESRQVLEESFPDQFEFTPRTDGTIPADRIERFLTVRQQLMPFCAELTELGRGMEEMEARTAELDASEEVGAADLFDLVRRAGRIGRGMVGIGNRLGEYAVVRNEALLGQEMGLGEYTWIYVLAYFSWLEHDPTRFVISDEDYPRIFGDRIRGNVHEMLRRQVETMERDDLPTEALEPWRAELAALDADPRRLPFATGLPPSLEASLRPFRRELEDAYCAATNELDFMRTEGSGWDHQHR